MSNKPNSQARAPSVDQPLATVVAVAVPNVEIPPPPGGGSWVWDGAAWLPNSAAPEAQSVDAPINNKE